MYSFFQIKNTATVRCNYLPRNAVTSSGAELPAAINVAPATSCESPRPVKLQRGTV